MLSYLPIYLAAILEGEIYYSKVCADAIRGELFWPAVLVCGALGGATGDQLWFYILRGRIHWLDRYPWMAKHRDRVVRHVHSSETGLILVSRFLPGLRTAIPIACAYARVRPLKFSSLNLLSAFLWASTIMLVVTKLGPSAMERVGLKGWWGPIIPAILVLIFLNWIGRPRKRSQ